MKRILAMAAMAATAAIMSGCIYKGAKCTEGTDISVGISIPGTEGAASVTFLNYLSGFRMGVAENAECTIKYTVAETNDFLGCIHTRTYKTIDATITPVEIGGVAETNGCGKAECTCGAACSCKPGECKCSADGKCGCAK